MSKIYFRAALCLGILLSLSLSACGGGSGGGGGSTAEEVASQIADELIAESQTSRATEIFGQGGNLYKPHSDDHGAGGGTMVVLFDAKYSEQFERCEVRKTNGEVAQLTCINNQPWTMIPYSCFSNGNRQTWRAGFSCWDVAEIVVDCFRGTQQVTFRAPDGLTGSVCERLG